MSSPLDGDSPRGLLPAAALPFPLARAPPAPSEDASSPRLPPLGFPGAWLEASEEPPGASVDLPLQGFFPLNRTGNFCSFYFNNDMIKGLPSNRAKSC